MDALQSDQDDWAPLIDVREVPIRDLIDQTDTAVARALRRVIESLDDPNGQLSAFQSFAST